MPNLYTEKKLVIIITDNIVTFSGRIINPGAADGFEIKRESLGSYKLKKTQTDKIFEPCNIH
mgnify:CR=1 FL=1